MRNPKQLQTLGMSYLIVGIIVFTALISIYSSIQVSQQHDQIITLQKQLAEFSSAEGWRNQQFNNLKIEMMAKMSDQQVIELKTVSDLRVDIKGIQKDIEVISSQMSQINQLKDSLNLVNQSVILLQATKTQGENNDLVHTNNLNNLSYEMNNMNNTLIQLKYDLTEMKTKLNNSGSVSSDLNNIALKSDIETVKASIQSEIQSVRNQITSHEVQKFGPFNAIHGNYFMTIDTKGIYPIATLEHCNIQVEKRSLVTFLATGVGHMFGPGQIIFLINGKTNLPSAPFGAGFLYQEYVPIYHQESYVLDPGTYEIQLGARAESGSGILEFNLISFIVTVVS